MSQADTMPLDTPTPHHRARRLESGGSRSAWVKHLHPAGHVSPQSCGVSSKSSQQTTSVTMAGAFDRLRLWLPSTFSQRAQARHHRLGVEPPLVIS